MPTLVGTIPLEPAPEAPCRMCGRPTDIRMKPPGTTQTAVPLHLLCAARFIKEYERRRAMHRLRA